MLRPQPQYNIIILTVVLFVVSGAHTQGFGTIQARAPVQNVSIHGHFDKISTCIVNNLLTVLHVQILLDRQTN